ncbi:MAG: DNA mismatch repair endonuclease MutL, partial [bacterium]
MLRDDAMLAFERHATSKLSDVKDLLSIATLGFRGEALPSIASVSRLVLETRAANDAVGTRVEIAGGKLLSCDEAAVAGGTAISVRDLFFNVPARKKFLRSEQTELAHIARLVTHYSLAHPDKSFQLTHGANELLSVTPVAEFRERIYQVFGARTLEDLIDVGSREREIAIPPPYAPPGQRVDVEEAEPGTRTFRLRGFVSAPQVQKLNRDSIYLFVNRRLIRDRLLLHALSSAYHNLIPPACYPFALLFLDCDAEEVDVNVHPAKTEVRFRHGSVVHDFVRDTVRETLLQQRPLSSIPAQMAPQPGAELPFSDFTQRIENENFDRPPSDAQRFGSVASMEEDAMLPEVALPEFVLRREPGASPRLTFTGDPIEVDRPLSPAMRLPVPETHGPLPEGATIPESRSLEALADLRPLGQIHDSFIVAAGRDGLWIVDQHVAHERILFEKILKRRASGGVETQR